MCVSAAAYQKVQEKMGRVLKWAEYKYYTYKLQWEGESESKMYNALISVIMRAPTKLVLVLYFDMQLGNK